VADPNPAPNEQSTLTNSVILPDDYYLSNFRFLLEFVESRYQDLLTDNEKAYISDFDSVDESAQRLYVRLVLRKGPLFRHDKLSYREIADIGLAARQLEKAGLLAIITAGESTFAARKSTPVYEGEQSESIRDAIAELLALLTKPELISLLKVFLEFDTPPGQSNKPELLEVGVAHLSLENVHSALPFSVYQPLGTEFLELLKLLFFGNMYQDFTEFVLNDLGVTPFEDYLMDKDTRFFTRREIIDDTVQLYQLNELSHLAIENNDLEALLQIADMAILIDEDSLRRRRDKIVNRIARQLERLDQHHDALRLFSLSAIAPARERQARIYHSIFENVDEALVLCNRIISAPEDEAEYEFAVKFGQRILKKNKLPLPATFPTLEPVAPSLRNLELDFNPEHRVEEATRRWYESRGHRAVYVENALFTGIFGLAFWDIVFTPLKGAFFNPFQRGPVDLFTSHFRVKREALIAARLLAIEDSAILRRQVLNTFEEKRYIANFLVNWQVIDQPLLELALDRIPAEHLLTVFERLLTDLRANRSGLPDLIVFPDSGGYQLVEVKGPGDKLQANQNRWIRHFERGSLPVEVVNVQWS